MARTDPQINFRIPADLKDKLDASAANLGISLTAEIVRRLESTFPAAIENELIESRRNELHKLRSYHRQAMHDLKQYRNRLAHGDTAPYGSAWLKDVILQTEYRVNRLERIIARTERELQSLGEDTSTSDDAAYAAAVARFEEKIVRAEERLASLRPHAEKLQDPDQRERSRIEIEYVEAAIRGWREELEAAKKQIRPAPSVLSQIQKLRDEIENER